MIIPKNKFVILTFSAYFYRKNKSILKKSVEISFFLQAAGYGFRGFCFSFTTMTTTP